MKPTKHSSSIIRNFTALNQEMELKSAKADYDRLNEKVNERKLAILSKKGASTRTSGQVSKLEKIKSLTEHKLPLDEVEKKLNTDLVRGLNVNKARER